MCCVVIHRHVHPQSRSSDLLPGPLDVLYVVLYCMQSPSLTEKRTLCLMRQKTLRLHIKPEKAMYKKQVYLTKEIIIFFYLICKIIIQYFSVSRQMVIEMTPVPQIKLSE